MFADEEPDCDAWSEGHATAMRQREWQVAHNPYEPDTLAYRSWADGYRCGVSDRASCRD